MIVRGLCPAVGNQWMLIMMMGELIGWVGTVGEFIRLLINLVLIRHAGRHR